LKISNDYPTHHLLHNLRQDCIEICCDCYASAKDIMWNYRQPHLSSARSLDISHDLRFSVITKHVRPSACAGLAVTPPRGYNGLRCGAIVLVLIEYYIWLVSSYRVVDSGSHVSSSLRVVTRFVTRFQKVGSHLRLPTVFRSRYFCVIPLSGRHLLRHSQWTRTYGTTSRALTSEYSP
jgi:hypothetical protein